MQKSLFTATVGVAALGLVGIAGPAVAATSSNAGNANTQSQTTHVSQAEVQKFAKAQNDMQSLLKNMRSKMQNAQGKQQSKQFRQQMNAKIVKTIKKDGLSVQQYNQIAQASQNDPKLSQRIQQAMQD